MTLRVKYPVTYRIGVCSIIDYKYNIYNQW